MAVANELDVIISMSPLLFDAQKIRMYCAHTQIKKALSILDTIDWESREEFLKPRGQLNFTVVHVAAYNGQLEILKRADALGVDLSVTDDVGRCVLHWAAGQGHVDVVRWLLEHSTADYMLALQDTIGKTALHLAVKHKQVNVAKFLVDARADVNVRDKDGMTPLHLAWIKVDRNNPEEIAGYENVVDILLGSPVFTRFIDVPIGASRTMVLDCAVLLNSPKATRNLLERGLIISKNSYGTQGITTPLHKAADNGFHQTLCILLRYRHLTSWMINMRNESGQTPLHVAVSQGQFKCAHTLVINKASLLSMRKNGLTVIDALFRYNERPMDFLTGILDAGVYITDRDSDTVTLDFQVLAPQGERQMAVVSALIRDAPSKKRVNILQHPLVEAFLGLKWTRLRYSFFILVAFQASFTACLFGYSVVLQQEKYDFPTARRTLFVCAAILLCHNTLQLLMIPKYYAKQFETWLSIICATICIVIVVGEESSNHRRRSPSWILQSVSVAILLASIQIMLLIGRFADWGYYAMMFSTVLKNVLKVFLAVFWIILGFSLSFSVLFHGNNQFDNPWKAFAKTVVMMMGEYEYGDLFSPIDEKNSTDNNSKSEKAQNILLPVTSRIVFLVFVMLASIVLMNLMIGLAVTDIQELLKKGLTRRLLKQAEFVAHLEHVTSHQIFQSRLVPRCLKKLLESMNMIDTKVDLGSSARYGKCPRGISVELIEKLFALASKPGNYHEEFQTISSSDENEESSPETPL